MAIFELSSVGLKPLRETRFSAAGIKERRDLQRALREHIEVIAPDCLVLTEEFGEWSDSKRRIDLLCIDKKANIVVVELKRDEEGGHMELQAIRYAAMVSTLTLRDAVDIYRRRLESEGGAQDPEAAILEHLGWDEPDEEAFGQDVRIILASAEFGKELTTAVLWLNEQGLDIRCVRLKPYQYQDQLLVDVQQVIPLPEAEEYQVRVKQKERVEKAARESVRDYTRFDVVLGDQRIESLPKRRAIFEVVRYLCSNGAAPEQINECIPWRRNGLFFRLDGQRSAEQVREELEKATLEGGSRFEPRRHYCSSDDELLLHNGCTYSFTNQWGGRTEEAMRAIIARFPQQHVSFGPSAP